MSEDFRLLLGVARGVRSPERGPGGGLHGTLLHPGRGGSGHSGEGLGAGSRGPGCARQALLRGGAGRRVAGGSTSWMASVMSGDEGASARSMAPTGEGDMARISRIRGNMRKTATRAPVAEASSIMRWPLMRARSDEGVRL